MSPTLSWALVALGLGVVVARRRSHAIALVTLQSLLLAIGAFTLVGDRSTEFLIAAIALLVKAVALGLALGWTMLRTREGRPIEERVVPIARFVIAVVLALGVVALVPSFGLADGVEHATVALVVVGATAVLLRRQTLFQALGLIMAENGIAIAAASVKGGVPIVIELGFVFDVIVIVAVAVAFHERIYGEFGTGDTEQLRGLRD